MHLEYSTIISRQNLILLVRFLAMQLLLFLAIALLFLLFVNLAGYHNWWGKVTYTTIDEGTGINTYKVVGADAATFKDIGDDYAIDNMQVYYQGSVINGADPETFSVIKKWGWSRDSKHIFAGRCQIQACDHKTFKFFTNAWQGDSKCVYRYGKMLQLADTNSFKAINFWYGKDNEHVFFSSTLIEGADAKTFHLLPGPCVVCARDKNRCYREKDVISCEKYNRD